MTSKTEKKSKIILLCLGLDSEKQNIKKVTVHDLHKIFKIFGQIKKIIIFSKKDLLKAFLEFNSLEASHMAQSVLHDNYVDNYGKARIYYSNNSSLQFSNRYLEYWDYQDCKNKSIDKVQNEDPVSPSPLQNSDFTKKNSISTSEDSKNSLQLKTEPSQEIKNIVSSFLAENSNLNMVKILPSKVVLVSNIENVFANVSGVFNFFCIYGDIKKLLFMSNLGKAMIEFTDYKYSAFCVNNLNNTQILASIMKVNYSKYQELNLNKKNRSTNSMSFNQIKKVQHKEMLYHNNVLKHSKTPTKKLTLFFRNKNSIKSSDLIFLVEKIVKPMSLTLQKSLNGIDRYVLKYSDINKAIMAIIKLNNLQIRESILHLFFSQEFQYNLNQLIKLISTIQNKKTNRLLRILIQTLSILQHLKMILSFLNDSSKYH